MKIDRLIGILTILLQKEKVTAPELAERFEVSRRTIMRDIDTLDLAGIPIVTSRGGDGGISIMEGYKINKNVLTTEELQNLVAGLKGMDSVSKTSNFELLVSKLASENAIVSLPNRMIIDLSSNYKDSLSEKIEMIKRAIEEECIIRFDYYYRKGEMIREIEPYFIQFQWNAWYVFGWCRLREDFRRFKMNRLWNPKMIEEKFVPRPIPAGQADAEHVFPEKYHAKILFDKSVRFRLIEEYGLHCYEETEKGLLFTLDYTNKEYALGWIWGFGDTAEVLEPEEMRREFAETAKNIFDKYH